MQGRVWRVRGQPRAAAAPQLSTATSAPSGGRVWRVSRAAEAQASARPEPIVGLRSVDAGRAAGPSAESRSAGSASEADPGGCAGEGALGRRVRGWRGSQSRGHGRPAPSSEAAAWAREPAPRPRLRSAGPPAAEARGSGFVGDGGPDAAGAGPCGARPRVWKAPASTRVRVFRAAPSAAPPAAAPPGAGWAPSLENLPGAKDGPVLLPPRRPRWHAGSGGQEAGSRGSARAECERRSAIIILYITLCYNIV